MHELINEVKVGFAEVSRQSLCDPIFYGHLSIVLIVTNNAHVISYFLVVSIERPPLVLTCSSIAEMLRMTIGHEKC